MARKRNQGPQAVEEKDKRHRTPRAQRKLVLKNARASARQTRREATLILVKGHDDVLELPVDHDRMKRVCPAWRRYLNTGGYTQKVKIEGMDFQEDKARFAVRMVIDIVHGAHDISLNGADPRLLFYMTEIHEWLGKPKFTYRRNENPQSSTFGEEQTFPFFHQDAMLERITVLEQDAGYMYRVHEWLLLAVVAQRLGLQSVTRQVRDNLSLFYRMDQKDMPVEVRHSCKDREWSLIQDLGIIGKVAQ
ncbi:hypothetical protein F66182_1398 [Fusarium sp. NRRL 66182]|nr:hypothetical protein F66182_1398 [Fusarium sp. NRRL 66182]